MCTTDQGGRFHSAGTPSPVSVDARRVVASWQLYRFLKKCSEILKAGISGRRKKRPDALGKRNVFLTTAIKSRCCRNEFLRGKPRGIKPGRFRNLHLTTGIIRVICEICGLNLPTVIQDTSACRMQSRACNLQPVGSHGLPALKKGKIQ